MVSYVLSQRYTIDTVLAIFGLSRRPNTSNRPHQLDHVLVSIILKVMTSEPTNARGRLLFWHHLHYLFVHLLIYQFIKIGDVMKLLRTELSKPEVDRALVRKNRDMLMWLLLQYISGAVAKDRGNQIEEFLPVIELFNFLYGAETELPIPNESGPSFITATAALCIFMHLQKAAARRENLTLAVPLCLEAQKAALQNAASPNVAEHLGVEVTKVYLTKS